MKEFQLLDDISLHYQEILGDKLVGIYVHGSIAFGCFNWDNSDIDFLVVVSDKPTLKEKEFLIKKLIKLEGEAPKKGFEMSVVCTDVLKPFIYPTPYELHFGNEYLNDAKNELRHFCMNMNGTDKDLASHIAVLHACGVTLYGDEVNKVFGIIKKEYVVDSNYNDIKDANDRMYDNPVYYILNLCRFLAYLEDGIILSKVDGGLWALNNSPIDYHDLIRHAMASYQQNTTFLENGKRIEFVNYMMNRIDKKVGAYHFRR